MKHTKDYTLHILLGLLLFAIFVSSCSTNEKKPVQRQLIQLSDDDGRGLRAVTYLEDGDTCFLDPIDSLKIDSLFGHTCKWSLCPYKGVKLADWKEAVLNHTKSPEGSDGYNIDILHLQYPSEDYDQLEERLINR